jgi:endonuclease/exonuclease/phosphatase family metal-dependent hydrolase
MFKFVQVLCLFLGLSIPVFSQSVVVNEYFNASSNVDEWVELVIIETTDMRGFHVKDYTGSGGNGGDLVFTQNALWQTVEQGTILVIVGANIAETEDFDSSDGLIIIKATNSTYFSGSQFNIGGTSDAVQITNASDVHIHGASHGSGNASSLPTPKAHFSGTLSSGQSAGFLETTAKADFSNSTKLQRITTPTLGAGNDTDNTTLIASFKAPEQEATLKFSQGATNLLDGSEVNFGTIFANAEVILNFSITNLGLDVLEVTNIQLSGSDFFFNTPLEASQLANLSLIEFSIAYQPRAAGESTGSLTFSTNDQNQPSVTIQLLGNALDDNAISNIADIRNLALGTIVTVAGRVTVANEFNGPSYFQDETAGLSIFFPEFHAAVQRGDSVQVTGPLAEFGTTTNGRGLLQISGSEVSFNVIDTQPVIPVPKTLTISQLEEIHQSQLVKIENVTFGSSGSFQGNTNYDITDGTGSVQIRIDGDTDLLNATIPTEPVDVIAVLSRFGGTIQVLPRSVDDLAIEEVEIPGSDIPLDHTFDVVTWNVVWFGSPNEGPSDDQLQIDNVAEVIQTMDADVYALQEVASITAFNAMVAKLDGYRGFVAPISQTQKTAFVFKTSVVDSLSSGFISTNWSNNLSWASGRYPFEFIVNVTINNKTELIYLNNIHAKALGDAESYERRVNDSQELKELLDATRQSERYILLGDYNDFINKSTYTSASESPYQNFVDDPNNWKVITQSLEERGLTSYRSSSMLDHITMSNELFSYHIDGSEQIENPVYIGNYLSSTSDHYPVKTRFIWGDPVSNEMSEMRPLSIELEQNYPNPFNPSTSIAFRLDKAQQVQLTVYSVLGEKVTELVAGQTFAAGRHEVRFDASRLASGTYVYQLRTGDGRMMSRMMTLIK